MRNVAGSTSRTRIIIVTAIALGVVAMIGWGMSRLFTVKETGETEEDPGKPTLRADFHFTVPDKWKNDPQRPIYVDGEYHYYYLYNRDYPDGNGTEWRRAVSADLVRWEDKGVAIPKYTTPNGDPWSGSVVLDPDNTAGFGEGALVAIVTQPSADGGRQEQYLWYSTDKGNTFTSYSDTPVMANPGTADFRDPKIIWDPSHHKWVMLMAEGSKIGFYESNDLKEWRYISGFETADIGILECPDLFEMRADNGSVKWVLGTSANGKPAGLPGTYAYWTGTFDGQTFEADQEQPKWLDYGFDWYGAVTFEDGKDKDKLDRRYALAWMNHWDYANVTPTLEEGFNGMDSIVREIKLKSRGGESYALLSEPVKALDELTTKTESLGEFTVNGSYTLEPKAGTYRLDADILWSNLKNAGLRLRESEDSTRHADVGIFVEGGYSYVNRAFIDNPDKTGASLESRAPFDAAKQTARLTILVDKASIEVFIDDGEVVHSSLIYPQADDQGITLFTEGGEAVFSNVTLKRFD